MAWVRLTKPRTDKRFRSGMGLLVNVGCGVNGKQGWVNVDSTSLPGVAVVYDCRRRIPLETGSAAAVFTEHLLEHLDYYEEAPVFLRECQRILEPEGVLRIVVPDGRKYLLAYADGGWDQLRSFSPLASNTRGFNTPMEVVNAHFRQGGQHRFSYDFDTLRALLMRCGFEDVRECSFGESQSPLLAIDAADRASESLYVEATIKSSE
jgi:predicted SAM-dependent methyltransferase